jgi:integrase/recombinase XerC
VVASVTGAIAGRRRRVSWKDSYDAYLQSQRLEFDRSPETLKAYEAAWLEFTEYLSSRATLEDVPQAIARYREVLRKRRLKENTISLRLTAVHSYFKWCLDSGVTRDDPLYRLKLPRKTHNPRSIPTSTEMAKALRKLSGLPRLDRLIIALATYAGLRSSEMRNLNVESIDLKAGKIHVLNAKGHKDRDVTLHPELAEMLRKEVDPNVRAVKCPHCGYGLGGPLLPGHGNGHPESVRISKNQPWLAVKRHFPDNSPHDLRAAFITICLEQGVPIEEVAEQVGHESVDTTTRYKGRRNVTAQARLKAVNFGAPEPTELPPGVIRLDPSRRRR